METFTEALAPAPPRPSITPILPLLRPGQILLSSSTGWFGDLIRKVTGSPWSHAALLARSEDIWITIEALSTGLHAYRFNAILENPNVTALLIRDDPSLTGGERIGIVQAAWLEVGAAYDTTQLLGMFLQRQLPPWLGGGLDKENHWDRKGRRICSESVSLAWLSGAKRDLTPEKVSLGNVDPGHLAATAKLTDIWRWPPETEA